MDAAGTPAVTVPSTRDELRNAGLRATGARIAVLEALIALGGHPTADDVVRELEQQPVEVSRATVFNALDDLTKVGIVMIADAGPGATRYEPAASWHHHFVCVSCGAIADVTCTDSSEICLTPSNIDGIVEDVQVIFRGTCTSCLETAGIAAFELR